MRDENGAFATCRRRRACGLMTRFGAIAIWPAGKQHREGNRAATSSVSIAEPINHQKYLRNGIMSCLTKRKPAWPRNLAPTSWQSRPKSSVVIGFGHRPRALAIGVKPYLPESQACHATMRARGQAQRRLALEPCRDAAIGPMRPEIIGTLLAKRCEINARAGWGVISRGSTGEEVRERQKCRRSA